MTGTDARTGPIDLAFLDELVASQALWSDRDEEGAALARHLLDTRSPIVVLHGPARSGKTELIRRRVAAVVERSRRVSFHDGDDLLKHDLTAERDAILFWDSFETWLVGAGDIRDAVVRRLLQFTGDGPAGCRLVLIVNDDALSRLFRLCGAVPQIVDDMREIPRIATRPLFDVLARTIAQHGVSLGDTFLSALSRDLDALNAAASAELAAILAFELCRSNPAGDEATKEDYEARGRLPGILEAHLDFLFERLPEGVDSLVGWAVLQEMAAPAAATPDADLAAIASRFDVPDQTIERVLAWLEETRHIVRRRATGGYDLIPPQLSLAAAARQQRDANVNEHQRWILRQAVRHFIEAEALLSEQSFKRLHLQRSGLKVTDEEAKLMLRCAIVYEDSHLAGATDHWLRRVKDPDAKVDVLLEAVFDSRSDVRHRAAARLGQFPRPDVRNQLHLLALRDPCPDVRVQAIESLDGIKDDELRASLIQELHEASSPYRLQAIEALRIFHDATAVDALVQTVQTGRAGEDVDGRRRAVDVLGRQQTIVAIDALLDVALHDPDCEDRQGAARALAATGSEEMIRFLLDRLDEIRRTTKAWHVSMPLRLLWLSLLNGALAAGAVAVNVAVHGFILATMKWWRVALAVTLLEAASIVLWTTSSHEDGLALFAATFIAGIIVPTRILVGERLDSKPQGRYRRCLGVVLFAFCSATVFVYFHGLACMLARRVRLGLVLAGFEVLGIGLVFGATLMGDRFAGFQHVSPVFNVVGWSLAAIGIGVLVVTYFGGVVPVWLDAFVWRRQRKQLERIDDVHTALLRNPFVPGLVLRECAAGATGAAPWSRGMLQKFGADVQGALRPYWETADIATRRKIFAAMARGHRAESMAFLKTASRSLGWQARAKYLWAGLAFRMAVWPTPLVLAGAIALFAQFAAVAVLAAYLTVEPDALVTTVTNGQEPVQARIQAVDSLRQIAVQQHDHAAAVSAALGLNRVMTSAEFAGMDQAVRGSVLAAVAAVAPGSAERQTLVTTVGSLLASQDFQEPAVETLKRIGTEEVIRPLKDFIERPVLVGRKTKENPIQREGEETRIKLMAIDALGTLRNAGVEPLKALNELSTTPTVSNEVRIAAQHAASAFDPLVQAEYRIESKDYPGAIVEARKVLAEGSQEARRTARAQRALIRAYAIQGSLAFDRKEYAQAKDDLLAAVNTGVTEASGVGLFDLGLNLAFQYHEMFAPEDGKSYSDVYEILSKLRPLVRAAAATNSIQANLAEASLTTGRYDQAAELARDLLMRPDLDPTSQLNMKFIIYAALALKPQPDQAERARQALMDYYNQRPAGFVNDWAYGGTSAYLQRTAMPEGDRERVLQALQLIRSAK